MDYDIGQLSAPSKLSEFVGNVPAVKKLQEWLRENLKNRRHPRRVCFLTGATGCGKSTLAHLALKEAGFTVKEFLASDMRVKPGRELLLQYLRFLDVVAMIKQKREGKESVKKAALVECVENMTGQASQELYRNIREMIKAGRTYGVPVIFTGTLPFRGKRPMNTNAVFIHMRSRNQKELLKILDQSLRTLQTNTSGSPFVDKLLKSPDEMGQIAKKSGGDARRMFKFLEFVRINSDQSTHNVSQYMEIHEARGPLAALSRIMRHDWERSISAVMRDVDIEGMRMPFGVHGAYLSYIPWAVQQVKRVSPEIESRVTARVTSAVAENLAIYGKLVGRGGFNDLFDMTDVATTISTWGTRIEMTKIPEHLEKVSLQSQEYGWVSPVLRWRGQECKRWWLELEKGVRRGDENVETPCMSKTLRGHSVRHMKLNLLFQMVAQGTGNALAWTPDTVQRTAQLVRVRDSQKIKITSRRTPKEEFEGEERVMKLGKLQVSINETS